VDRAARAAPLIASAASERLPLAALGGVAVRMLCPSARDGGQFARHPADIDLATTAKHRRAVDRLVQSQGFAPDEHFNAMNGDVRLRYFDQDESHVDVFVDELRLCHVVSWRRSLQPGMSTIPVVELVLSKLQIVEAEGKDRSDLSALLVDQWSALVAGWPELERAVSDDWGLWRTGRGSLEAMAESPDAVVAERSAEALARWRAMPLSTRARLRGRVGERVRWYELPEEV